MTYTLLKYIVYRSIRFNKLFAGFKLECEEERAKGRHDAADVLLMGHRDFLETKKTVVLEDDLCSGTRPKMARQQL